MSPRRKAAAAAVSAPAPPSWREHFDSLDSTALQAGHEFGTAVGLVFVLLIVLLTH